MTLDELAALVRRVDARVEQQGTDQKQRTDEVVASVKTLTDEVNLQDSRLRAVEDGRERDQQRMTSIEASNTMLGTQIRGVGEAVSRIENETKAQTASLKLLEADKIGRDAVSKAEERRRGHLYQLAGVAIALLTLIGGGIGWLITQHQAEKASASPPALVAPH